MQNFILAHQLAKKNASNAVLEAPEGYVVTIRKPTRTILQNNRLWALLTDVSKQVDWYGKKLTPEEWKDVFTAALKKQDVVPGIDGGFVVLGRSTSNMNKSEMVELQELISAFGSDKNIKWSDYDC